MKHFKFNRLLLLVLTIITCASFVAAVLVFMSPDKTISNGDSAAFTCTVDPMSGTANYNIKLTGNGVNKVLQSGSVSDSSAQKTVNVGPSDYNGVGTYSVTCSATEMSCDPCCCSSDSESATLIVTGGSCPADGWYCTAEEWREYWRYDAQCQKSVINTGEHCNDFDGCYPWSSGCEGRDYSCNPGVTELPCVYTYSDRHEDYTEAYIKYCDDALVKKHQKNHDYYCGVLCDDHTSWINDQVVENCNDYDGWYDTTDTRWVANGVCNEKKQKKQAYRDYTCSTPTVSCTYAVTGNQWVDTGETRYVPDGTVCNDGLWCTTPDYCTEGVCGGDPRDCSYNSYLEIGVCDNIPDSIPYTWDFSPGFESVCDEVHDLCTESNRTYTHTCDIVNCGAECESDLDCEDGNPYTTDTCLAECTCEYEGPQCGDGTVQPPETCELPGTSDNPYCEQTTSECSGYLLGLRDAFGNCDAVCGCTDDPFDYACVEGSCGAECDADLDCEPQCLGNVYYYGGACDMQTTCACLYDSEDCDVHDGWYLTNETRWVANGVCMEKEQVKQEYRNYYCALPDGCDYDVTDFSWVDTGNTTNVLNGTVCNDGLWCTTPDYCTEGVCGGDPRDCSYNSYLEIGVCDNIPDSIPYTWDYSPGFESVCDEVHDLCTEQNRTYVHECSIANCSAECEDDIDCADKDPFTLDVCLDNCSCEYTWVGGCGDGMCEGGETCSNCPADCGSCPVVSSKKSSGGGGGGGNFILSSVAWDCGEWSPCINGAERRTCQQGSLSKEETRECALPEDSGSEGSSDEEKTASSFTVLGSSGGSEESNVEAESLASKEDTTVVSASDEVKDMSRVTGFSIKDLGLSGFNPFWLFILVAGLLAAFAGYKILKK
ncbi:hypothetical protein JW711_05595 [Candidatus Woesearchaeota archaeon]|nr:hypothetical protein [Candidatus Woesearchaeota archaeon]